MLQTNKSTMLSGQSMVGGTQVASYSANVDSDNGSSNISSNITNQEQYDANKAEVRKDLADFTAKVYEVEDQMAADTDTASTDTVNPDTEAK